jgi:hypothetical protein
MPNVLKLIYKHRRCCMDIVYLGIMAALVAASWLFVNLVERV